MEIEKELDSLVPSINKFYGRLSQTPGFSTPGRSGTALKFNNGSKRGINTEYVNHSYSYSYRMTHPFSYFRCINRSPLKLGDVKFLIDKMRIVWFPDTHFVSLAIKTSDLGLLRDNMEMAKSIANTLGLMCFTVYDESETLQGDNFGDVRLKYICSFTQEELIPEEQIYTAMKAFGSSAFRDSKSSVYFCMTETWPKPRMFENPLFNFPVKGMWQMHDIAHRPSDDKTRMDLEQLTIIAYQLKLSFTSILSLKNDNFAWCMLTWDIIAKEKGIKPGLYYTMVNQKDQSKNEYKPVQPNTEEWNLAVEIRSLVMVLNTSHLAPGDAIAYDLFRAW